ncbi:MAG TPA: hypothetical protein VML50_18210 [Anaeromyxobacter sp.]|nr:hypothetical protein [Anaeromyxobacter sp.]
MGQGREPKGSAEPEGGLAYAEPDSRGWRLMRDPASTSMRLVLALVGPSGVRTRGVGFNLRAGAAVRFGAFESGLLLESAGVYEPDSEPGGGAPEGSQLVGGGVMPGNVLTVGVFERDARLAAKESGVPLLRIALEPVSPDPASAGHAIPLEVLKARVIPEEMALQVDAPGATPRPSLVPVEIAVGMLTLT